MSHIDHTGFKWVTGSEFEASGYAGNQVQNPDNRDYTKLWQNLKSDLPKLAKYADEGPLKIQDHTTGRRRI